MADESEFDGFVVDRSPALLRSAYLLVHDEGKAEDLLQTALTKAWFAWKRIEDPEAYVRRIMVTTSASWWRRRWNRETPTDERSSSNPPGPVWTSPRTHRICGLRSVAFRDSSAQSWCFGSWRTGPRPKRPTCWAARSAR